MVDEMKKRKEKSFDSAKTMQEIRDEISKGDHAHDFYRRESVFKKVIVAEGG